MRAYNKTATAAANRLSDHVYCTKSLKATLLTLDIPPTLSTRSRAGNITAAATTTRDHADVRAFFFYLKVDHVSQPFFSAELKYE